MNNVVLPDPLYPYTQFDISTSCLSHTRAYSTLQISTSAYPLTAQFGIPINFLQNIPRILYNFQALLNPHTSIPYVIFDSHNILCIFSSVCFFIMGVTGTRLCSFKGLLWLVSCFIPTSYAPHILPILHISVFFNFLPFLKTVILYLFKLHLITNLTAYKFYISNGHEKCTCEWTTQPTFMRLRGRAVWTCWKVRLGKLRSFITNVILRPLAFRESCCAIVVGTVKENVYDLKCL